MLVLCIGPIQAQPADYNFRHLGAAQGLSDGVIRAIGQDKYGYIWIGTLSGLNRFDGYTVTTFYNNAKDSTSLPAATVRAILGDSRGRLWIGTEAGMVQYDFAGKRFLPVSPLRQQGVYKIIESGTTLYLLTEKGIVGYNPQANTIITILNGEPLNDFTIRNGTVYAATDNGLLLYNIKTAAAQRRQIPAYLGSGIHRVCVDNAGNIWCTPKVNGGRLVKGNAAFETFNVYDAFQYTPSGYIEGIVTKMLVDKAGRLWCGTDINGLARYDAPSNSFIHFRNDPLRPGSLSANLITDLFQGGKGFIWAGTEGHGVDYFHPDQNLFQTLLPPIEVINKTPSLWMRSLAVDKEGTYWMGIGGGGLASWNPATGQHRFFNNAKGEARKMHSNSVRSLLYDKTGTLWVGTAGGVNQWDPAAGKLRFLERWDSLPRGFYWTIVQDSRGTIWFGRYNNLFYRDTSDKKVHTLAAHPQLAVLNGRGVRTIFEDSKHRLWFGMNGTGLVLYDPLKKLVKQWQRTDTSNGSIINNTIHAITEDKMGVIWISSATGLTAYDERTDKWEWYTQEDGLPSLKTSGLIVDAQNRLWIGSTAGLIMLDQTHKTFKTFDLQDGLPTMEFSDMPATRLPDGRAAFPTLKGFVVFRPELYKNSGSAVDAVVSQIRTAGTATPWPGSSEELKTLRLHYNQNFFTLQLTAFNYYNPDQTWYAYKLDGFDNDWIYTKERMVNYTNVPGGRYTFRFKATADPNNWSTVEKNLQIVIGTVFYKTPLFIVALMAAIALLLYLLYKNRIRQQRRIFQLQTKAQALEKEKASVMYESLKQQLNPHFLFNSLTSLGSLIKTDPNMASHFLSGMSKIYRYILSNRDVELVPLKNEISFVENYIQLQKARFETGLEISLAADEESYHKKVVPVTLQNLIENAIKHNIIDEENPLNIRIYTEANWLVVQNNLQKKRYVETSNKQGLKHLKSLYRYLSNEPLQIIETEHDFIIKIPLL
jgi:ligand-binding sensor domain-containing protein